jgi:hypothetical protein
MINKEGGTHMIGNQKYTDAEYSEHQFRCAVGQMRSFGKRYELSSIKLGLGSAVLTMRSHDDPNEWVDCVLETPFLDIEEE